MSAVAKVTGQSPMYPILEIDFTSSQCGIDEKQLINIYE